MNSRSLALCLALLMPLAASAEERTVRVPGDRSWTRTGIRVEAREWLEFRASGEIDWGKGQSGPGGTSGGGIFRPMSGERSAGLVGRVAGTVFWIGTGTELEAPADGELELGINDDKVSDNAGEFRVEIRTGGRGSWSGSSASGFGSSSSSSSGSSSGRGSTDWDRYRDYNDDRDFRDRRRDWFWWRGKVDGVDQLVLRGDTLRIKHLDKDPIQRQEHRFSAALPLGEVEDLRFEVNEGRGKERLLQRPGRYNDWTAIIELDDSDDGGAGWYEVLLSWNRPASGGGSGYDGLFRWRGRVDIGCRIAIRGSSSTIKDAGGRGTQQRFADFTSPLPSSDVPVSVRKTKGRGKVRLVETPSHGNGFTAVVEIDDDKGGADDYEFELGWRR